MQRVRRWSAFAAVLLVIAGGAWLWWNFDLRWRPHTIDKNQVQIARILDGAGWVSPHLPGPRLYMISYRSCPDCIRFEREAFPKLHAAGVDTRVIVIARADTNGLTRSTAPERATVAELWLNRDWNLLQRWLAVTPPDAWTAPGLAPADGDAARTAVVETGRKAVEELRPLLKANGVNFAYPTLIWWTKAGVMHGCACEKAQSYGNVERELGA
ncbi:MAG: hypothetical protein ABI306_07305 [Caulobacteraceae bacterium]